MSFLEHLEATFAAIAHRLDDAAKDVEHAVTAEVRETLHRSEEKLAGFFEDLQNWGAAHPLLVFAILRRIQPILVLKKLVLVTRFEDVEEVLARDDVFDVPYEAKMRLVTNDQNFFLGMRDGARYTRDQSTMRVVVRRDDVASLVEPFVAAQAEAIVARAPGRLDVVKELTEPVPARLVGRYFGTPGPSEATLVDWATTLFWFLFLDANDDAALRRRAVLAAAACNAYLDGAIAERKRRRQKETDDILERSLTLQDAGTPGTTDLELRNDFLGLIIGAIPTTATATALALDELLRRPDELARAQRAAAEQNHALVARYVFEAMRFNPLNPGIFRLANREFVLAKGERRATTIPEGATVIAATQSAMFDSLRIDAPNEFVVERPARDYLFWGYGLHTCFGQYVNQVQIPALLEPLLRRQNLRRAGGPAGTLQRSGPFAAGLTVLFD